MIPNYIVKLVTVETARHVLSLHPDPLTHDLAATVQTLYERIEQAKPIIAYMTTYRCLQPDRQQDCGHCPTCLARAFMAPAKEAKGA